MSTVGDFKEVLKKELEQRMNRNPLYSLRAFAKDLKMAPPHLSDILNGKRGLSRQSAGHLAGRLGLTAVEKEIFCDLVESQHARSRAAKSRARMRLDAREKSNGSVLNVHSFGSDEFSLVADWYHLALLELVKTSDFRNDNDWIASRLGIKPFQVQSAIERLLKFGVLKRVQDRLELTSESVQSPDGIPSQALKNHHEQFIQKALKALYLQPVEERDFRGLTIRCKKSDVPHVRAKLKSFLQKLDAELSNSDDGDEVYQLSTQFFCLTQSPKLKGESP